MEVSKIKTLGDQDLDFTNKKHIIGLVPLFLIVPVVPLVFAPEMVEHSVKF